MVIWMVSLGGLSKSFLSLQSSRPFIFQPLVILQQGDHGLGFLSHVESLVFVVLNKLEILQSLNGENVFFALLGNLGNSSGKSFLIHLFPSHLFTAGLDQILQQHHRLVDMSPVLAVIVQSFPDHLHDLGESDHVIRQVCTELD